MYNICWSVEERNDGCWHSVISGLSYPTDIYLGIRSRNTLYIHPFKLSDRGIDYDH